MPVDKLEKLKKTDIDPSSITLNMFMSRVICCSECGRFQVTLRRVKGDDGKKTKPSRFICVGCYKK